MEEESFHALGISIEKKLAIASQFEHTVVGRLALSALKTNIKLHVHLLYIIVRGTRYMYNYFFVYCVTISVCTLIVISGVLKPRKLEVFA